MKGLIKMDDFLREMDNDLLNIKAERFAELVQKKTIYDMFEVAAEASENDYENFKAFAECFPSVCTEGSMYGAKGRVAITEEKYTQLVCTEQNLYELYLLLEKENFHILVGTLLKFFNIKRNALGFAELVPAVERNERGYTVKREGAKDA